MRNTLFSLPLLFGLLFTFTGPGAATAATAEPASDVVVAKVNGKAITMADLIRVLQQTGQVDVLKKALKSAVIEEIYLQEAAKQGIHPKTISASEVNDKLEERLAMVEKQLGTKASNRLLELLNDPKNKALIEEDTRRQLVVEKVFEDRRESSAKLITPSAEEIDEFVATYGNETLSVRPRHIVVATKKKAEAALKKLNSGADFANVAKSTSLDAATKDKGGDMGDLPLRSMAPTYRVAMKNLKDGDVSKPFKLADGKYALIQITGRKLLKDDPQRLIAFAKENIKTQKSMETMANWTKKLTQSAKITFMLEALKFPLKEMEEDKQ